MQPLPKAKFLTNFFHGNQFFEWTHFLHVGRKRVELTKFDLALKETEFFSFMRSIERREESHWKKIAKRHHKSFWRKKHGFLANMDIDIPTVHGARPDNLVPALKQALILLLSTLIVLGKNHTFSSTNWENEHDFETLSALTLKIAILSEKLVPAFEVPLPNRSQHW